MATFGTKCLRNPICRLTLGCRLSCGNILLLLTIFSVFAGVALGFGLRSFSQPLNQRQITYIKFPGELFLRALKMCILPLIVSSLITSLGSLDTGKAGRIGLLAVGYYFTTTVIAVIEGVALVLVIRPGHWVSDQIDQTGTETECLSQPLDTMMDVLRNLFPENIVEAATRSAKSCARLSGVGNSTDLLENTTESVSIPYLKMVDGMNILGLIAFSIAVGAVVGNMGDSGRSFIDFFTVLEKIMMRIISRVIWYSPVGITFLIGAQIAEMGNVEKELYRLVGFVVTVVSGLLVHGIVVLPLIYVLIVRKNPFAFMRGNLQAFITALGTSSSSATLPLTIKCLTENNGVDPQVVRFMIPLGATINMDGTALYEAVAVIYIAQTIGANLGVGEVIVISLTATLASIGAAGIPQAGLVTMVMVLIAAGLPSQFFILVVPVDWFLDRIRTMVNVLGDTIGAGVVDHLQSSQTGKCPASVPADGQPSSVISLKRCETDDTVI